MSLDILRSFVSLSDGYKNVIGNPRYVEEGFPIIFETLPLFRVTTQNGSIYVLDR